MNKTIGEVIQEFMVTNGTFHAIISLLVVAAALMGLLLIQRGLRDLMNNDSSRASPVTNGLMKIGGGSALLALPFSLTLLVYTLLEGEHNSLESFKFTRIDPSVSPGGESNTSTLTSMFANFALDAAGPLSKAVMLTAMVWGLFMIITAISRLANSSNPNSPHFEKTSGHLLRMGIGTIAVAMPTIIDVSTVTLFGADSLRVEGTHGVDYKNFDRMCSILQYGGGSGECGSGNSSNVVQYSLKLVALLMYGLIPFGLIAFFSGLRGLYLANDATSQSQGATVGGSLIKIFAGIALLNMQTVSCITIRTISPIPALLASDQFQQMCYDSGQFNRTGK